MLEKYDMDGRPTYEIFNELCRKYTAPKSTEVIQNIPPIKNVIFNNPATIVFWADNTKTVVKCENEDFDPEKGLAMAISKKALGNQGNYFNQFKKWTEKYHNDSKKAAVKRLEDSLKAISKSFMDAKTAADVFLGLKEKSDET